MRLFAATLLFYLAVGLAVSLPVIAQPDAYAQHWPVQDNEAGIYAVTLTPQLYAQIEHAGLDDLAAFNAAGETLGFEPLASVWNIPEPQWHTTHWFALPPPESGQDEGLLLQVARATDGSVRLRAEVGKTSTPASGGDLLVDTGIDVEANLRLQALSFEFDPQVIDLSAQIRIDASHDLETWRNLVGNASLLQLQQGGQMLQRRQIELSGQTERYLRLRRLDADTPLPLASLKVQTRAAIAPDPRPTERLSAELLSAELVPREGGTFVYRLPARIPVEQVNLRLAQDNTVVVASLASRDDERDTWRSRGRLTAFQLRAEGVELDNEPLRLGGSRDREWQVEISSDLTEAPALEFSYRPERWLLLTQGTAPYVIAAGSTKAIRSEMPLAALLAPIRAKYGAAWQPPEAALGEPVVIAGDAATEATLQERWSGPVLWIILICSALAIALMVMRLLRERTQGSEN